MIPKNVVLEFGETVTPKKVTVLRLGRAELGVSVTSNKMTVLKLVL